MDMELSAGPAVGDRRVRRSRSALLAAAVRLVSERGTTDVSVTELAEAADVSRRVLYEHFESRDGLMVAAAAELLQRELLPHMPQDLEARASTLVMARHMAEHRAFYRAILTGSCAHPMTKAGSRLFRPFTTASARQSFGHLDEDAAEEVGDYFAGAMVAAMTGWLVDGPDPLDPDEFADRTRRIQAILTGADRGRTRSDEGSP